MVFSKVPEVGQEIQADKEDNVQPGLGGQVSWQWPLVVAWGGELCILQVGWDVGSPWEGRLPQGDHVMVIGWFRSAREKDDGWKKNSGRVK